MASETDLDYLDAKTNKILRTTQIVMVYSGLFVIQVAPHLVELCYIRLPLFRFTYTMKPTMYVILFCICASTTNQLLVCNLLDMNLFAATFFAIKM